MWCYRPVEGILHGFTGQRIRLIPTLEIYQENNVETSNASETQV